MNTLSIVKYEILFGLILCSVMQWHSYSIIQVSKYILSNRSRVHFPFFKQCLIWDRRALSSEKGWAVNGRTLGLKVYSWSDICDSIQEYFPFSLPQCWTGCLMSSQTNDNHVVVKTGFWFAGVFRYHFVTWHKH